MTERRKRPWAGKVDLFLLFWKPVSSSRSNGFTRKRKECVGNELRFMYYLFWLLIHSLSPCCGRVLSKAFPLFRVRELRSMLGTTFLNRVPPSEGDEQYSVPQRSPISTPRLSYLSGGHNLWNFIFPITPWCNPSIYRACHQRAASLFSISSGSCRKAWLQLFHSPSSKIPCMIRRHTWVLGLVVATQYIWINGIAVLFATSLSHGATRFWLPLRLWRSWILLSTSIRICFVPIPQFSAQVTSLDSLEKAEYFIWSVNGVKEDAATRRTRTMRYYRIRTDPTMS